MLLPPLLVPPKSGRVDTWYCAFGFAFACACVCANAVWQPAANKIIKRIRRTNLARAHRCCVVIFFSSVNGLFSEEILRTGFGLPQLPLRSFFTDHFELFWSLPAAKSNRR